MWHFRTLKARKRRFQGHLAANLSDGHAAKFVNIGRNVVFASGTGSRDKYITITQEYKGRRELTQSSCPKVTHGRCLLQVQTCGHTHASINAQGTGEAWHPRVDYDMNSCYNIMTNFATKSGAARAAPAAPLRKALYCIYLQVNINFCYSMSTLK